MERAGELVDLAASVVDVVLPGDREARERQEGRGRVSQNGATPVSNVKRPGRVRRHVFDIDRRRFAHPGTTVVGADRRGRPQCRNPCRWRDPQVDETGARSFRRFDAGGPRQCSCQAVGEFPRAHSDTLCQDQAGVGGKVPVRGVARWTQCHRALQQRLPVPAGDRRRAGDLSNRLHDVPAKRRDRRVTWHRGRHVRLAFLPGNSLDHVSRRCGNFSRRDPA